MAREVLVLRETDSEAARDAARALADAMIRATTASATERLLFIHCSKAATNRTIDCGLHIRIVQTILGLTLKLRIGDKHRQNRHQTFANVLMTDFDTARNEVRVSK